MRPDIIVRNLRGNVDTRLRKLSEGEFDGIIIAAAGLIRLGLQEKITRLFSTEEMTPAAGQGIITVECRKNHEDINKLMAAINDKDSEICSIAERTFLGRLGGGCQIPTGSHCFSECEGNLKMTGIIGTPDGMKIIRETGFGKDPVELGNRLAEKILAEGGKDILNGCQ
jgi:hydroxymethylbilane synthase